uniref:ABC transmembrane type-1 domain-containing protein n=1 Tax=Parascaris equorum TaxID=6256 RepID=A0A914R3S5_PAREQ
MRSDQLPPLSIVRHGRDALYAVSLMVRTSFVSPLLVLFPAAHGVAFAAFYIFALSAHVVGESLAYFAQIAASSFLNRKYLRLASPSLERAYVKEVAVALTRAGSTVETIVTASCSDWENRQLLLYRGVIFCINACVSCSL